jgi:hypothetical protein
MSSQKKVDANRDSAKKSSGPRDTSSTRYNAEKHRLLSKGFTELDDLEYCEKLSLDLIRRKKPVGMLETQLLERAVYDMVGWKRAQVAEGRYITGTLNPPLREKDPLADLDFQYNGAIIDPGIPASIGPGAVQEVVKTYQRYQTCHSNRLFRTLHEFDREQRIRRGESLPAPIAVDISVCAETESLGSVNSSALTNDEGSSPIPITLDADTRECNEGQGSTAESEQEKVPPTESEKPMLCKAAGPPESKTLGADVGACNGGEGSTTESEQEKIPPPESEKPQAMPCNAASRRESVTQDADVQACNGGAGSPTESEHQKAPTAESEQENVPPANVENFASPAVNIADIGSGSVNKPPVAWRPPVKSGPIWSK